MVSCPLTSEQTVPDTLTKCEVVREVDLMIGWKMEICVW